MEDAGALDLHQTDIIAIAIIITIFLHQMVDAPRNHGLRDRAIVTIKSPEAQSDGVEGSWKNSTIAVRSNRDRGAIEPRSWIFNHGFKATISVHDSKRRRQEKRPGSRPDRLTIVVRSPLDHDHDQAQSWHPLKQT